MVTNGAIVETNKANVSGADCLPAFLSARARARVRVPGTNAKLTSARSLRSLHLQILKTILLLEKVSGSK